MEVGFHCNQFMNLDINKIIFEGYINFFIILQHSSISGQHLRIVDITKGDQGKYICRADNRFGRTQISAELKVLPNLSRQSSFYKENQVDVFYSDRQGKTINSVESDETIFNTLLPNEESALGSYSESTQLLTNHMGCIYMLKIRI